MTEKMKKRGIALPLRSCIQRSSIKGGKQKAEERGIPSVFDGIGFRIKWN